MLKFKLLVKQNGIFFDANQLFRDMWLFSTDHIEQLTSNKELNYIS